MNNYKKMAPCRSHPWVKEFLPSEGQSNGGYAGVGPESPEPLRRVMVRGKGAPLLQVRVDAVTLQGLRAYAAAEGITKSDLVRRIILAWERDKAGVRQSGGGVFDTVRHMDGLVKQLQLRVWTVRVASGVPSKLDVQADREELYRIAIGILKDAAKLSENEELAAKSQARLDAMQVATQAALAAECILRDYQRGDITWLVDELVKTNERLKEELRAFKEGATAPTPGS